MNFAVIMAGGSGKRLWPLSRRKRPKQVLKLLNGKTLLRKCFERLEGLFDHRNILVLTNADYVETVCENLPELREENIIAEPVVRDTAGAIGLAASVLGKYDHAANMIVVTADQILEPAEPFQQAARRALSFVDENPKAIVTFGIKPTYPAVDYGYLRFGPERQKAKDIFPVDEFKEKPDQQTAGEYIESGNYYWNSGIFVFKCETILNHLKHFLPGCVEPLRNIQLAWGGPDQHQTLLEWFPKLPRISIDYAVMEKADRIFGIPIECRWLDMGSFAALADVISADPNNNIVVAKTSEVLDCRNSIVVTEDKDHLLALVGMDNVIVAHSRDATLVCPISQAHRLKELLEKIKDHHQGKYL